MVGHGGSSADSYLADPTSPIPSHCASIVATSTLRVKCQIALSTHTAILHYASMGHVVNLRPVRVFYVSEVLGTLDLTSEYESKLPVEC